MAKNEELDIKAIKARAEAATPGPWVVVERRSGAIEKYLSTGHNRKAYAGFVKTSFDRDARFIAHAREDVPALLAEIDRLTAALATITQRNSDEVDEYNAGFEAGESKQDRYLAWAVYREAHPETPQYDVFDSGWVMGALGGSAENFDELAEYRDIDRRMAEELREKDEEILRLKNELAFATASPDKKLTLVFNRKGGAK